MTNAVDLIHRQLECFKYVGGSRDIKGQSGLPSGEGMDVSLVLLPDLLLDVRYYNFHDPQGRMLAVGGRSARMACALLHLLGEDDGTFQVHLLTKTGKLGRLLLENEFDTGRNGRRFSAPFFEQILLREGEPRCAIRNNPKDAAQSSWQTRSTEITREDLEQAKMSELLHRARVICLTSMKMPDPPERPDFPEILEFLIDSRKGPEQGLFIDTRRAPQKSLHLLSQLLKSHPEQRRAAVTAMLLRNDEEQKFLAAFGEPDIGKLCVTLGIPVIEYGGRHAKVYLPGRSNALHTECDARIQHEGIAECFKAGILLAWSVRASLPALTSAHPALGNHLLGEWPAGNGAYWQTVLEYAAGFAKAREKTGNDPCRLKDLFSGSHGNVDHLSVPGLYQAEGWLKVQPSVGLKRRMAIKPAATPKILARLAGRRRTNGNGLECRDLPLCEQPLCPGGCTQKKNPPPLAAVLIDLDSTLMNSTTERDRGLAAALAELQDERGIDERIAFFTRYVYKWYELYNEPGLRLGDFRQEWNHHGWYITYLVYTRYPTLLDEARRWAEEPGSSDAGKDDWQKRFHEAYKRVQSEFKEEIHRAAARFEHVRMYPYKEARDFLRSLQMAGSIALYVVSEGHPGTQWDKLRCTGLDDFFDREHLLTTGDAVESAAVREPLEETRARLQVEAARIQGNIARLKEFRSQLNDLENKHLDTISKRLSDQAIQEHINKTIIETHDTQTLAYTGRICNLEFELATVNRQERVIMFVEHVIERMKHKNVLSFYACAIRAILRDPLAPRSKLEHFESLIEMSSPARRLKFAMVGDRQTNDIEPPARLLKDKIVTIRLDSLAYSKKEPVDSNWPNPPMFVATTLAQVKAILLAKETWAVSCATDPPIFNWTVDTKTPGYYPALKDFEDSRIGIDHVTCGCSMLHRDFPFVSRICAGILAGHLVCVNEVEQDGILKPYLNSGRGNRQAARDRTCLLCALVRTGALYDERFSRFQFEIARQIVADADQLKDEAEILMEVRTALDSLAKYGNEPTKAEAKAARARHEWPEA